jgi:peptidoglycan hydrolase-like protein with peptidoglycan-binding domain
MAPTPDEIAAAAHKAATMTPSPDQPAAGNAAADDTPGRPDLTHKQPIVTSGAAGPLVRELVDLLAVAGHATNTIIDGENPGGVFDNSVLSDVRAFQAAHQVQEDPEMEIAGDFVGPNTWQALYDVAQQKLGL